LSEVVGAIRVTHNDVFSPRSGDSASQGASIASIFNRNHGGSSITRDLWRFIRAAIIGDNDFAGDLLLCERSKYLLDTSSYAVFFIQTRQDYGKLRSVWTGEISWGVGHEMENETTFEPWNTTLAGPRALQLLKINPNDDEQGTQI
jgi:hypothetical protein